MGEGRRGANMSHRVLLPPHRVRPVPLPFLVVVEDSRLVSLSLSSYTTPNTLKIHSTMLAEMVR